MPRGRIAALRTLAYGFVLLDVFVLRTWVVRHADLPGKLYNPLFITRFLPAPTPTPLVVRSVEIALTLAALVGISSRLPRLSGMLVFILYLEWMLIAFSYGKVDHDRVAFLVALAVLPTVGPARWGDLEREESAGWAIHCIQVAVVMTYFASVFAKVRFGGVNWVTGATLMRAVIRRGTFLAEPLTHHPGVLRAAQFMLVGFELLSPLLLVRGRIGMTMLAMAVAFHLVTGVAITIVFWPHVLCLFAFLPLERINPQRQWLALTDRFRRTRLVS
jgi:hypothetical protein